MTKVQNRDYKKVGELYSNERVKKFLGGIVSDERFHGSFDDMINCDENSFYFVVRLKDNNEFIGLVLLDKQTS